MRHGRLALALLALLGVAPGHAAEVPEPDGYQMDDYRSKVPATVRGAAVIHTEALKALLDAGLVVLIDVASAPRRPAGTKPGTPWMPLPHRDIPGSVWLPEIGRGALSPAMEAWFRTRLAQLTEGQAERRVVIYCHPDCWMSWNAAKRAASFGYHGVIWYPDGIEGWQSAGLPLAEATPEQPPD